MGVRGHLKDPDRIAQIESQIDGDSGPRFEHHQMAVAAAIAGLGGAVPPVLTRENGHAPES